MNTKEELNALKEEVETLNKKLAELTEDELILVTGGATEEGLNGHIYAVPTSEVPNDDPQIIGGFVPKTEPVMSPSGESSPFDCNGYFFKLD